MLRAKPHRPIMTSASPSSQSCYRQNHPPLRRRRRSESSRLLVPLRRSADRRRRLRRGNKGSLLLVCFALFVCTVALQIRRIHAQQQHDQQQQQQQQRRQRQQSPPPGATASAECRPSNPKYDWEVLDYYEILGLKGGADEVVGTDNGHGSSSTRRTRRRRKEQQDRQKQEDTSNIDSKEVRKAYRRQAQLWHPDKISKKNNNSDPTTNSTAATSGRPIISIEESNARFAKIAEAYEVLSDPDKRQDYDLLLDYCRNQQQATTTTTSAPGNGATSLQNRFSSLVENLRDPFRVFEDFFYGGNSNENVDDDSSSNMFDPNDPFSFFHFQAHRDYQQQQQQKEKQRPYPEEEPVRVFHNREHLYDPVTGDAVFRIRQTEEYAADESSSSSSSSLHILHKFYRGGSGSFYYRVIAQDFKERYDPYTTGLSLVPITDPYVQEEGYRTTSAAPGPNQQHQQASASDGRTSSMESILHPWEVLTPDSRLLVSPNRKYVAGLSPECELLVMLDDPDTQDDVVWSSQTNIGSGGGFGTTNKNSCFAIMKGPHLIIAMGHPHGVGNRILWYSEALVDDERDEYYDYEDEYGFWHRRQRSYLAQLDNDGSLAVYSVWSLPSDEGRRGNLASKAWMTAKDWMNGRIRAPEHDYGHLYYQHIQMNQRHHNNHRTRTASSSSSSTSPVVYKRCVYSTSQAGCYRLGRRLAQLSLEIYFRIKSIISKMNDVTDSWLDLIYEEDDLFYSMKESLWKNGHAFGSKMTSSSARFVRKVLEHFSDKQQQS